MSENVVNTLIVNFGESATNNSGSIVAEWDESLNVDEKGEPKSHVFPGDQLFLLEHHGSDVQIVGVKSTSGSVVSIGNVILDRSQELAWGDADDTQNLRYSPHGVLSYSWMGRVNVSPSNTGREIKITDNFLCLAVVDYRVMFGRYLLQTQKMTLAKEEEFPFRAYIYYTEAAK